MTPMAAKPDTPASPAGGVVSPGNLAAAQDHGAATASAQAAFALSPTQQGMLFHHLYAPQSGVDVEQLWVELEEEFDAARFAAALGQLVARHEALRTRFRWEGQAEPVQEIVAEAEIPLASLDWSDVAPPELETRWQEFLAADRRRGFDLSRPPLTRVTTVRIGPSAWRLAWACHHIIGDGTSYTVMVEETFRRYDAPREGVPTDWPAATPFRAYVQWLERQPGPNAAFWKKQLATLQAPTPLPADREPGADRGAVFDSATARRTLAPAAAAALKSMAAAHRLSPNTLLLGAWALLLSRYSQESQVVFGTVMGARWLGIRGGETMIGPALTTVPFRAEVRDDVPVVDWLQDIWKAWIEIAMRGAPWTTALTEMKQQSSLAGDASLFETLLIFDHQQFEASVRERYPRFGNRKLRARGNTGYPISLHAYAEPEFLLNLEYDPRRIAPATAEALLEQLATILAGFAAAPQGKLADVEWMPAAEKDRVLRDWNATAADYPATIGAHELFERQAEATPERGAVSHQGATWSYAQLNARANQIARHLRRRGVERGSLVGICVERSNDMLAALLGIWKAGGAYVPLDPGLPVERLAFMAGDAQLQALIGEKPFAAPWANSAVGARLWLDADAAAIGAESAANLGGGGAGEDVAYVLYTSGSTGKPKGVCVPHRALVNFLLSMQRAPSMRADDVMVGLTTISFDIAGLELYLPLTVGARVEIVDRETGKDGLRLQQAMLRAGATMVQATPATWQLLLDSGWQGHRDLKVVTCGEALTPALATSLLERCGELWNGYGPTETTIFSAIHRVERAEATIPIGRPVANTQAYVLDRQLRMLPAGALGELYLGGAGLALGYLRRPELTAERFIAHPLLASGEARLYKTGDVCRYRGDGVLEYLGRTDQQVKLRGYRIELGEIESALGAHPQVAACAVALREDPAGHKYLAAYVVPTGDASLEPGELRKFLQASLPDYMIPAAWVPMGQLPLNPNGKVDRKLLPAAALGGEASTVADPPATETERKVAEIWRAVIGMERIGREDDFFAVGGDSLLAVRVLSRINASFATRVSLSQLFQEPTVAAQARALETAPRAAPAEAASAASVSGPTLFCLRAANDEASAAAISQWGAALGTARPLHTLVGPTSDADGARADQAAAWLREIAALQPRGPYYLVGLGRAGNWAWSLARRITTRGERVGLLVIIDSPALESDSVAGPARGRGWFGRPRRAAQLQETTGDGSKPGPWQGEVRLVLTQAAPPGATAAAWRDRAEHVIELPVAVEGLGSPEVLEALRAAWSAAGVADGAGVPGPRSGG